MFIQSNIFLQMCRISLIYIFIYNVINVIIDNYLYIYVYAYTLYIYAYYVYIYRDAMLSSIFTISLISDVSFCLNLFIFNNSSSVT